MSERDTQARSGKGTSMIDKNVRAALEARGEALVAADVVALGAVLHDDLAYTHSNGDLDTKAGLIGKIESRQVRYQKVDVEPTPVHEGPGFAVIRVRMRARVLVGGNEVDLDTQTLEVYVPVGETWQLVALQSTRRA